MDKSCFHLIVSHDHEWLKIHPSDKKEPYDFHNNRLNYCSDDEERLNILCGEISALFRESGIADNAPSSAPKSSVSDSDSPESTNPFANKSECYAIIAPAQANILYSHCERISGVENVQKQFSSYSYNCFNTREEAENVLRRIREILGIQLPDGVTICGY